jgi:hypothetical protein
VRRRNALRTDLAVSIGLDEHNVKVQVETGLYNGKDERRSVGERWQFEMIVKVFQHEIAS